LELDVEIARLQRLRATSKRQHVENLKGEIRGLGVDPDAGRPPVQEAEAAASGSRRGSASSREQSPESNSVSPSSSLSPLSKSRSPLTESKMEQAWTESKMEQSPKTTPPPSPCSPRERERETQRRATRKRRKRQRVSTAPLHQPHQCQRWR
jgi:hypothetical protein